MAAKTSQVLQDIVGTLRQSGHFASVSLGVSGDTTLPRAEVLHESLVCFSGDDTVSLWRRLVAAIVVHVRDDVAETAISRASDLADQAATSLLADPFRKGLCQDLPIGRATEIQPSHMVSGVRRPDLQIRLDVRCHFEEASQ